MVVNELNLEKPHTADFAGVLGNLKIERSCLVTTNSVDVNLYKSARNIQKVTVMPLAELNAADICNHHKMLITYEAFLSLYNRDRAAKK